MASLALTGGAAVTLLGTLPWWGTRSRTARLAPFAGSFGAPDRSRDEGTALRALTAIGSTIARSADRAVTSIEPLAIRLDRVHDAEATSTFRFRQGALLLAAGAFTAAVVVAATPPPVVAVALLVGVPLTAAVAPEFELGWRARRWSTEARTELPVVGEQLVALLRSGRSPVVALRHIGDDTGTPLRRDVARVVASVQRGSGLEDALRRWVEIADVDAVHRLAGILSLHHRTPDLANLVKTEVDAIRSELHRDLLALIDRRAQQVWIPVTVAALIPGAIFLLIPFFDALRLFGATS